MSVSQADLTHIYKALKIARDVIAESPELCNKDEHLAFLTAWIIVNDELVDRYKEYLDEDTNDRY